MDEFTRKPLGINAMLILIFFVLDLPTEMLPKWFDVNVIPFQDMCYDHQFWLPLIIKNQKLNVFFKYDRNGEVLAQKIDVISSSPRSTTC